LSFDVYIGIRIHIFLPLPSHFPRIYKKKVFFDELKLDMKFKFKTETLQYTE
jgi:hypothetical protein